jgi:hypothetical protein
MINKNIKYSYNDISIVPSPMSSIEHRNDCIILNNDGMLPLFTAPMSSVVDESNFDLFESNKINAILPRTVDLDIRKKYTSNGKWAAFSLSEFEELFVNNKDIYIYKGKPMKVLIDIANGHMSKMLDMVSLSKEKFKNNIIVMIGNIACPEAYYAVKNCGADYVRLGIGAGFGCITSSNTAIHYPMASLIEETVKIKDALIHSNELSVDNAPKIIADGGIRNYSDIIKALALGADYVMIGGVFSKMLESAADTYQSEYKIIDNEIFEGDINLKIKINQFDNSIFNSEYSKLFPNKKIPPLKKVFYGMSTKKAQKMCGKTVLKTSEGIERIVNVEYTMSGWIDNFKHYLQSAMSYTDSRNLNEFKKSNVILISNNSFNSINK